MLAQRLMGADTVLGCMGEVGRRAHVGVRARARGSWAVWAAWTDGAGLASAARLLSPFLFSCFSNSFSISISISTLHLCMYICVANIYTS